MSNRDLREQMADFYGDKSMSPATADRLVSLAEADRGGHALTPAKHPGRWLHGLVGLAAGIAITLLAAPLFNVKDGGASESIIEGNPTDRTTLVEGPLNSIVEPVRAAVSGCKGCAKVVETGEGFCCGKGRSFGVPMTSKKLYAALVGHRIDATPDAKYPCKACLKLLKTHGRCDHRALVIGKRYQSPVSYRLAKGSPTPDDFLVVSPSQCEGCRSAYHKNGRCDSCHVGFVAGRVYDQEADYVAALAAYKTLAEAVELTSQCESCAVAKVTDGRCEGCNVGFKDGQMITNNG